MIARRRNTLRSAYIEVRRFRFRHEFKTWWDSGEKLNWRVNSRHLSRRGTVEYWRCSFRTGRLFNCLSRLRIIFGFNDSFVVVSRAQNHPHNHANPPQQVVNPGAVHTAVQMEPEPMQTAQRVHIGPRPNTTAPNPAPAAGAAQRTTTQAAAPAAATNGAGNAAPTTNRASTTTNNAATATTAQTNVPIIVTAAVTTNATQTTTNAANNASSSTGGNANTNNVAGNATIPQSDAAGGASASKAKKAKKRKKSRLVKLLQDVVKCVFCKNKKK